MGKIIAREFLWLIVTIILALPLGVIFLWFLGFTPETVNLKEADRNYIFWMYLIGYFSSLIGMYIIRFVAMAIKTLLNVAPESSAEAAAE